MSRKVYCVYDRLSEECGPIWESKSDEQARRAVWQLLRKVPKYDRDGFKLYCIGSLEVKEDTPSLYQNSYEINVDIPRFEEAEEQGMLNIGEARNVTE